MRSHVRLDNWRSYWCSVDLDLRTSYFSLKFMRPRLGSQFGFAFHSSGRWLAVRRVMGGLLLQIGADKYLMEGVEVEIHSSGGVNEVLIYSQRCEVLKLSYKRVRFIADPTFDKLDERNEDFFSWLLELSRDTDMQVGLCRHWELSSM